MMMRDDVRRASLRRLEVYRGDRREHLVGGRYVPADASPPVAVDLGPLGLGAAWYDLPLPPCPDCDGEVVWAEAGNVPGARSCTGCGSLFTVACHREGDDGP